MSAAIRHAEPGSGGYHGAAELLEIIRARSFRRGAFTLSSGATSELYFNLKPTMMTPRGAYLGAMAFLEVLHAEGPDYIGGLEMGAVPMIGAVAALSEAEGRPVRTFFVRKTPKDHGTRETVEGLGPDETLQGKTVLVVDDVATSGGSIIKTVDAVRAAGAHVDAALVLVDREEGAQGLLADHGIRLLSILRASQFT
jgi:orotate phosphoribosyltransferase